MRHALLLAVAVLAAVTAHAADFTVPDDFATIQAGLDAAMPGDTVSVRDTPGPWFEKIVFPRSGTAGSPITLRAFPGDSPILDGTGVAGANMVLMESRSYVRFQGFEVRNNLGVNDGSGVRIVGAGTSIEIRDNRIHEMRGQHAMGITVYGTEPTSISNLVIDGNEVYDCDPARSEAVALNGNVEQFTVTNNVVRDVNNIGMVFIGGESDIQPDPTKVARNGVVRGNQVYRARSIYGGGFAGGIYVDGGRDIVVERNLVSECDLGIEIGAENAGIVVTGVVVRDNVLWENDKAGLVFGGFAAGVGRVRDSFFLNNTTWHNDTLGIGFGELWIQFAEDNVVRQNVFHAAADGVLTSSENGNVDNALDWNLWFADAPGGTFVWQGTAYATFAAFQAGSGQEASGLFADPELLAPASADFHLRATSPAVNRGDPTFVPGAGETDLDGAPRVSGGRVDLGADEATCGNGTTDPGETCDDGDLVDCDGCDSNCTPSAACGNGITCAPEQCDDGDIAAGDCCGPACAFEATASPCDDGDACTNGDACNGMGTCASSAAPAAICRGAESGAAVLQLLDGSPDTRDRLTWRWKRGEETLPPALGDPTVATEYTLCAYDASASPQPRLRAALPPGARWGSAGSGFRYRDPAAAAGGIRTVRLVPGSTGSARVIVRGRGTALPLPPFPLTPPVELQLRTDGGECWGAAYSAPDRNDLSGFTGRND